jgi:hypothetical protein
MRLRSTGDVSPRRVRDAVRPEGGAFTIDNIFYREWRLAALKLPSARLVARPVPPLST